MFLSGLKKLRSYTNETIFHSLFLFFCLFLPFQFALNPANGFDVAIIRIIIPVFFLILITFKLKNKQAFLPKTEIFYLLLLFIALAIFSIIFSQNISWSLRKILFLLTIFPVYIIANLILTNLKKKFDAILFLIFGSVLLSLVAIFQFSSQFIFSIDSSYSFLVHNVTPFFLGNSFSEAVIAYPSWLVNAGGSTYMRAFAIFPDPHMFSYYIEMLIPWSVAMWALSKKNRSWFLLFTVILIIANILTFTRGSYVALIAGSVVVLPFVSSLNRIRITAVTIFFVILFLITPHNPITERFSSSFDLKEGSNQARMTNWQQALSIISNKPFGVGIGSYSLSVNPSAVYREPIYAHNLYLDIAAELGIQTVLVFIAIIFFSLRSFLILSKKNPIFLAGISSITIFAIHSMVENPMYSVHVLPLFLIILALSTSNYEFKENTNSK